MGCAHLSSKPFSAACVDVCGQLCVRMWEVVTTHKARVYYNSYPHVLGVSLIQNSNSPPLPPLTSCSHVTNGVGSGTPLAIAFDTYTAVGDAPWAMMDVTTELPAATKRSPWENAAKADGGSVTLTLGNAGAPMEKPGISHSRNTSAHTQLVALALHSARTATQPQLRHVRVEPVIGYSPMYAQHSQADMVPKSSLPGIPCYHHTTFSSCTPSTHSTHRDARRR